jgi:hypothetical protein
MGAALSCFGFKLDWNIPHKTFATYFMKSAVCTLFGGQYHHYGLGALANSLFVHGFRGTIFAGYDGPLPPWVKNLEKGDGYDDFKAADGLMIRFIPLQPKIHFACYKPDFMLQVWEKHCPEVKSLFYFDPDITISCNWKFFEEWVEAGVALCHNVGPGFPCNHPFRYTWRKFMEKENLPNRRELDEYFNSGFIGVKASDCNYIKTWAGIIEKLNAAGLIDSSKFSADPICGRGAYFANDQDALNIAAMASPFPISSIGQEAMGFAYGGSLNVMLHAIGSPKPWAKSYIRSAFKGRGPSSAEKAYWDFTKKPISTYSPIQRLLKKSDLLCGKILGRYL